MGEWDEMGDDELMAALGEAVAESGDVSDRRREAARAAFTWRTVDAELAELLHDSALEDAAAVRSSTAPDVEVRTLSFRAGATTLEVEVDGEEVLGEVVGSGASFGSDATVTLQRPGLDDVVAAADATGFVRFTGVGGGPVRFVVDAGGGRMTTPWVIL